MNKLITDGLFQNAAIQPAKAALLTNCVTHTYGTLAEAVTARAAHLIRELSPCKGKFILLAMNNSHLFVEWFLAVCEAGGIAVPVNPSLKKGEWIGLQERYQPSLIIADRHVLEAGLPDRSIRILAADAPFIGRVQDERIHRACAKQKDTDIFYMALSSGTTGVPKGILRIHRSWVSSFYAMSAEFGLGREDSMLLPGPLYYSATLISLLHLLCIGGTVRLLDHFDATEVLEEMQSGRTTSVFMVPTMYTAVMDEWDRLNQDRLHQGRAAAFPPVRTLITAGAKMGDRLKERVQKVFVRGTLYEYYGAAEIGFVSVQAGLGSAGSVGHAFHGVDIQIRNEKGDVLPAGEDGEIFARSEMMAEGYFGSAAIGSAYKQSVWKSAGDIGHLDDTGILRLVGRKSEMFISGGINIYPAEIESTLNQIEFIREAAVFGAPDTYWGEKAVAGVVLEEPPDAWEEKVREILDERLVSYKIPKVFLRINRMPLNSAGKVNKSQLLNIFLTGAAQANEGG